MKRREPRVTYYTKTTDDFAGTNIRTQTVSATFPYVHKNILWRAAAFALYYGIALPLVTLYIRCVNRTRFVNRKALRRIKGGCFLYGNHTHWSDAFLPHVAAAMKRTYMIAGPDAVSIKGIRNIVQMVGGIPVPSQLKTLRQFSETVKLRCAQGSCITVYPEAHIWPYYTGVRPFPPTSFTYPAEMRVPVVAMVTRYRKSRLFQTPARTVVFSDPIVAEPWMNAREARDYFHQRVSRFMRETAEKPDNFEYIRYEQRREEPVPSDI